MIWAVINNYYNLVRLIVESDKFSNEALESDKDAQNNDEDFIEQEAKFAKIFAKPENAEEKGTYTPLHWAAFKGYLKVASTLIYHKFDPLRIDKYGNTALHQACASNNYEVIK